MTEEALDELRRVGELLDRDKYPRILDGGVVRPFDAASEHSLKGQEQSDEQPRQRRSSAGPWQRPARREGPSLGSRQTRAAAPVVDPGLRKTYADGIVELQQAYPDTVAVHDPGGVWLRVPSTVLRGLGKTATFLLFVPYLVGRFPKAWGFWCTAISFDWIGPRHTNFPDGSVCAFEPTDGTWSPGGNLVTLVDLYTLWALRHEHMRCFGRWPGKQSVWHPRERLTELKDSEYCGCANPKGVYAECCKPSDALLDQAAIAQDFLKVFSFGLRSPPASVLQFMRDGISSPPLASIY